MTVGELIEKLNEFPKQVDIRFCTDIPGNLRSILRVEDIGFDTDISPDEPLNVDILLKEVGKVLPPSMVFWNEVSEVVNWYEKQLGRKLTQAERACIRYQCAIMQSEKPEIKDLKKLGICLDGLKYGGSGK